MLARWSLTHDHRPDLQQGLLSKLHLRFSRYGPSRMVSPAFTTHSTPQTSDLSRLASLDSPVISIYMNTHAFGRSSAQDGVRFGDLVDDLARSLGRNGNGDVKHLLAPLRTLARDDGFWQHQQGSIALFGNEQSWECFVLGDQGVETVAVNDTALLLPLVPHVIEAPPFLVLALSKNRVRLLECDAQVAVEADQGNIPVSFDDALRYEDPQAQLQFHSPGGVSIAHGHGIGDEVAKERFDRFLRAVDRSLVAREKTPVRPLVLAAVDYTAARYRHLSKYPAILDAHLSGTPDRTSSQDLHHGALSLIRANERMTRTAEIERVRALVGTGNVETHADEIAESARAGRVATLFLADGDGLFREDGLDSDSRGTAINHALIETVRHGGEVVLAPSPLLDGVDAFAVTRW